MFVYLSNIIARSEEKQTIFGDMDEFYVELVREKGRAHPVCLSLFGHGNVHTADRLHQFHKPHYGQICGACQGGGHTQNRGRLPRESDPSVLRHSSYPGFGDVHWEGKTDQKVKMVMTAVDYDYQDISYCRASNRAFSVPPRETSINS
jgi:hypothetical protein